MQFVLPAFLAISLTVIFPLSPLKANDLGPAGHHHTTRLLPVRDHEDEEEEEEEEEHEHMPFGYYEFGNPYYSYGIPGYNYSFPYAYTPSLPYPATPYQYYGPGSYYYGPGY